MRRFLGHLPMVRLASGQSALRLDDAQLRQLPFDEWQLLDRTYPHRADDYAASAPLFLDVTVDDSAVDVMAAGRARAAMFHVAALLVTGVRLASPSLSTAYLLTDSEAADVGVDHGVAHCELIVFGSDYGWALLDEELVARIERVQARLAACAGAGGAAAPAIGAVTRALIRTTRPGFEFLLEAMHLVAGLEALLVGPGEPLTATFARRYSVLAADTDATSYEGLGRALYDLRSDLLHGREIDVAKLGTAGAGLAAGTSRQLVCTIGRRALSWLDQSRGASLETFHRVLDSAYSSPSAFEALRPILDAA